MGGGFIEWKGYTPPKKGAPKYPYSTMKELQVHADKNKLSISQIALANEIAVSGKSEADINAFIDKVTTAMVNIVKTGLTMPPGVLPGPIKLKTKARGSLQTCDGRRVREAARPGHRGGVCAGRFRRECARSSRGHGAHRGSAA